MFAWLKNLFKNKVVVEPLPKVNTPEPVKAGYPELPKEVEAVKNTGTPKSPDWSYLWDSCHIDTVKEGMVKAACKTILANKSRYELVETYTGVPWYLIGALHYREASLNFNTVLHNGETLTEVNKYGTRLVPKGRGKDQHWTWEAAAIDALRYDGLDRVNFTGPISCLVMAEKYNGMGYRRTGELSPYVWAGTNHHDETGKYKSDGKYDSNAPEKQLGVAAIFKGLGV